MTWITERCSPRCHRIEIGGDLCAPPRLKHAGAKTFQFEQLRRELFLAFTQQHSGVNRLTMMFSHVVQAPNQASKKLGLARRWTNRDNDAIGLKSPGAVPAPTYVASAKS
ncbi:hypothetical protein [Bradyrhizobium sp. 23AC]